MAELARMADEGGTQHDARAVVAIEIEQMLLGAILLAPDTYNVVAYLEPDHFFDPLHKRLWWGIGKLVEQGRVVDPHTVAAFFESNPELNAGDYIIRLQAATIGTAGAAAWAREVLEHWRWRQVVEVASELQAQAAEDGPSAPVATLVESALHKLDAVVAHSPADGGGTLADANISALAEIDAAMADERAILGVPTGLGALDTRLGGFMPGNLIVQAGRPGMGKSALAGWTAATAAAAGHGVCFFSIEMPREDLVRRWYAAKTGIPYEALRKGDVSPDERRRIGMAGEDWAETPLYIDDSPRQSITQMRAKARRFAQTSGTPVDLIIVDYLQLIRPSTVYRGQRINEMAEISADLRALGKDLNCAVLALSQLNRDVEKRDNKRPFLSDLRESGTIEQDADAVLLLYREEYYLPEPKTGEKEYQEYVSKLADCANKLEINIAKNRHGQTGTIVVHADMATARFR